MQTTFILAGNFGVTPFEIMRQDLDEVIMIVTYLSERGKASGADHNMQTAITEKEQDKNFWSAF